MIIGLNSFVTSKNHPHNERNTWSRPPGSLPPDRPQDEPQHLQIRDQKAFFSPDLEIQAKNIRARHGIGDFHPGVYINDLIQNLIDYPLVRVNAP